MNHRWSRRRSLDYQAEIFHQGRSLGRVKVSDISLGGVFVQQGRQPVYPNDVLEIRFCGLASSTSPLRALVVHGHSGGAGLMFVDNDSNLFCQLRDIYYGRLQGDRFLLPEPAQPRLSVGTR